MSNPYAGQQQYGADVDAFAQAPYGGQTPHYGQQQYAQQPYGSQQFASQPSYGQPGGFAPQPSAPHMQQPGFDPFQGGGGDAFMTGFATDMLQQSGASYLQRGQAFMQQRMGFMSTDVMHYFFNLNAEYVRAKLLMLVAPFLRRWNYTRVLEQISGGHKYLPPRQDVNAPDLYIPLMGAGTYCLAVCLAAASRRQFKPELMTAAVSTAFAAWTAHTVLLKTLLYLMGIPGAVPFLELVSYAGYAFVHVCIAALAGAAFGRVAWYVLWGYGALCMAIFTVRTIKRVIFHEARQYRVDSSLHNYVLLGLALFQFPFMYYLGIRPPLPVVAVSVGKAGHL